MFRILLRGNRYRPDRLVTLRSGQINDWQEDLAGNFEDDAWVFVLDEDRFGAGMVFKFVLGERYWMLGDDIRLQPMAGQDYLFADDTVEFPPATGAIIENGAVQQRFFPPNLDESILYDVVVIGSGVGGGIVAEQCADLGLNTLVLELGSYLFPTHVGNLPRQHRVETEVSKHIWSLWDDFRVVNYDNAPGSAYQGGQGFCLGGRSVFWGGFIPRMTWWELDRWPQTVRWYLEDTGYARAEQLLNRSLQQSPYQDEVLGYFNREFRDYLALTAPMAVQNTDPARAGINAGLFSTADLLMESRLTGGLGGDNLTINLNHAVTELQWEGDRITGVVAHDLISDRRRVYRGRAVVLAAGTVESTKLALLSDLADPGGLIGQGITDHPIYFTHFALPPGAPLHRTDAAAKFILRHRQAGQPDDQGQPRHRYNMLMELGADFNQGRYLDPEIVAAMAATRDRRQLCELVFLFDAPLLERNRLTQNGPSYVWPLMDMHSPGVSGAEWEEINRVQGEILAALGAEALPGTPLTPREADPGGVAHEVGSLRMGDGDGGVVDPGLRFRGYDNLHVCDLSVFPSSPAANPTLTLAALALKLSDDLHARLR